MSSPLIGITTYRHSHEQGFPLITITEAYVQAVSQAGGCPVLIPLGIPEQQIHGILSRLDGALFSGGGDVDPARFGGEHHPEVNFVDIDRDLIEIQLIQEVIHAGKPFLGICRGIQMINVALGGTLYTHIPDQLQGAIHHPYIDGKPRNYLAHTVQVKAETLLFNILGQSHLNVNSMHHQGIDQLAPGLLASAFAPDGLVEGVELEDHSFGVAVQWHPEWLTTQESMRGLFKKFIEAAA